MSDDITHDLDLLDDWLAGKGYGEEAGLVLRALSLIHKQAREINKLRAALNGILDDTKRTTRPPLMNVRMISAGALDAAAAALKETE